jgi:PAS domain S-box-containing protein
MTATLPIWLVDVVGSVSMIVLSLLCVRLAWRLRNRDRNNVIWAYLLWVAMALTLFAVSRSVGHIVKQILLLTGHRETWSAIRPVSGALNSIAFIVVASVTFFFERTWSIYQEILNDKQALQSARDELLHLNQNLEELVVERSNRLIQSETKYRRIFEGSKDMILLTDRHGAIIDINPVGYEILAWDESAKPLLGLSFGSFFNSDSDWRHIMNMVEHEDAVSNAEIDLKRFDDSVFRTLITGSKSGGITGGEDNLQFIVKDIEERVRMEEQMTRADKLASIGELSAGIAHEINNPLGIILGYAQLLLRSQSEGTETYDDLKTIEKHVKSCKVIVEDLLNFARSSKPEKDAVDIHALIDDVVDFIQQHAGSMQLTINKDYDLSLPRLVLDEKKIKQVFINLIMNAKHAVNDKGVIQIMTRFDRKSGQVQLEVSDNGSGIDSRNVKKIFDPFFTTKPTGEGTGLGLSVSYGIVKNHGGDIRVHSTVGKGTTFTIALPAVA